MVNVKDPPHDHHKIVLNKSIFTNNTPERIRQEKNVRKQAKVRPEGNTNNAKRGC